MCEPVSPFGSKWCSIGGWTDRRLAGTSSGYWRIQGGLVGRLTREAPGIKQSMEEHGTSRRLRTRKEHPGTRTYKMVNSLHL